MAKTYNTISSFTSGAILTATQMNQIGTNVNNYRVPPACMLQLTADTTVTNNSDISWSTTPVYDTDSMFSSGTPTRVTPTTAGIYLVTVGWGISAATALGVTYCYLGRNGSLNYANSLHPVDGTASRAGLSTVMSMNGSTDYVTAGVGWASATGTVTMQGTTADSRRARLSVTWLGQTS